MITNLSYEFPNSNGRPLVAAINGCFSVEETIGDTQPIHFRSFAELPPRTPEEDRALAWEPKLSDPEPNPTHEARIDCAIKKARDLYEASADKWPVTIWSWARGGYGWGHAIPEDVDAILYIDGALIAFECVRRAGS